MPAYRLVPDFIALLRSSGLSAILLRGIAGSCINKAAANGLMFLAHIFFARQLGLEGFGIYALALAWIGVLLIPGRLGYDLATVRFVSSYQSTRQWTLLRGFMLSGRIIVFSASTLMGAGLAVAASFLRNRIGNGMTEALVLSGLILPLLALVQVEAAAIRGMGRVILGDIPFSFLHPVLLVVGAWCAVAWANAPATPAIALTAYFAATVVVLSWLVLLFRNALPRPARCAPPTFRLREWLTTAPAMMLMAGFSVILNQSATIIVGFADGPQAAGIYGAAARISSILQIIVFSLVTAVGPIAARTGDATDRQELQRALDLGMGAVFVSAAAAAVGIAVLGQWLLSLFGAAFVGGYDIMLVLVGGQMCAAAVAPAGIILNMTGHQNTSASILAVAALTNIVLCIGATMAFGPLGAATATAVTTTALNVAMAVMVRRKLGLRSWISATSVRSRVQPA